MRVVHTAHNLSQANQKQSCVVRTAHDLTQADLSWKAKFLKDYEQPLRNTLNIRNITFKC